jgi:hypothetical protein
MFCYIITEVQYLQWINIANLQIFDEVSSIIANKLSNYCIYLVELWVGIERWNSHYKVCSSLSQIYNPPKSQSIGTNCQIVYEPEIPYTNKEIQWQQYDNFQDFKTNMYVFIRL